MNLISCAYRLPFKCGSFTGWVDKGLQVLFEESFDGDFNNECVVYWDIGVQAVCNMRHSPVIVRHTMPIHTLPKQSKMKSTKAVLITLLRAYDINTCQTMKCEILRKTLDTQLYHTVKQLKNGLEGTR
eukprot:GHVO01054097.1.p1 GENE.GHVO01054097.1~~GHVO01054097.1.p1  ORF type:complete len:128 (+),score=17.71 GHVO01054097.1:553-936(+)